MGSGQWWADLMGADEDILDCDDAGIVLRAVRFDDDLPAMVEVVNDEAAESGEFLSSVEEMRSDLSHPILDRVNGLRVAERDGRVAGFATLFPTEDAQGDKNAFVWLRARPAAGIGVESALLRFADARAGEMSAERGRAVELLCAAGERQPRRAALLAELGYAPTRYFFTMAAPLSSLPPDAAELPPGYRARALSAETEMADWVAAFNESFVDHWHHSPLTVDRAAHFARHDPSYRPAGNLVAVTNDDGRIAGFCQCTIRAAENARRGRRDGWIGLLGTRRGHRRRGLGRAMLHAGMEWLRSQGLTEAWLMVDADSPTGATGLYRSAGFEVVRRRTMYSKMVGGGR